MVSAKKSARIIMKHSKFFTLLFWSLLSVSYCNGQTIGGYTLGGETLPKEELKRTSMLYGVHGNIECTSVDNVITTIQFKSDKIAATDIERMFHAFKSSVQYKNRILFEDNGFVVQENATWELYHTCNKLHMYTIILIINKEEVQ